MNQDLLRIIDSICRDKNIDRDGFIADLEGAMASAVRKAYDDEEDAEVTIDLASGDISATVADISPLARSILTSASSMSS